MNIPAREQIGRYKYTENDAIQQEYQRILKNLQSEISELKVEEM